MYIIVKAGGVTSVAGFSVVDARISIFRDRESCDPVSQRRCHCRGGYGLDLDALRLFVSFAMLTPTHSQIALAVTPPLAPQGRYVLSPLTLLRACTRALLGL